MNRINTEKELNLQPELLALLEDVFTSSAGSPDGVEARSFRLPYVRRGVTDLDDKLQALKQQRLLEIRHREERYRVQVYGLAVLHNPLADELLSQADLVWEALGKSYEEDYGATSVSLGRLAHSLDLSPERAFWGLKYLDDLDPIFTLLEKDEIEASQVSPLEPAAHPAGARRKALERLRSWVPDLFERAGKETTTPHKNAELNSGKREQVLGAALAALAADPDEFRNGKGKVVAERLAAHLDDHSYKYFGRSDPPLKQSTMEKKIGLWLQKNS